MADHTEFHAASKDGEQLSVRKTSTDSPILPSENIRELQSIDPRFVDFVLQQTEMEAEFRRKETKRTNTFVFTERMSGVVAGVIVALTFCSLGFVAIMNGHDWAGTALCGFTLVSIISIFVTKKITDKSEPNAKIEQSSQRSRNKKR